MAYVKEEAFELIFFIPPPTPTFPKVCLPPTYMRTHVYTYVHMYVRMYVHALAATQ